MQETAGAVGGGGVGLLRLTVVVGAAILAAMPVLRAGQGNARAFNAELLVTGEVIRYRDLRRDDFLAVEPPPDSGAAHGRIGAVSCVSLTTDPRVAVRATELPIEVSGGRIHVQVENLGFIAFMDRGCSWWNPRTLTAPRDYILQHEQIHFALFEIAARRLNDRAPQLTRQAETVTTSRERAVEEIRGQIDREMERALDEALTRSSDFDRDTSRTYQQDLQDWWWQTVTRELEADP